jgi:HAD superfamily hydrolase (TIGR01662 family)
MNEVVVVMGFPSSGKTKVAQSYVDKGHVRLNRDTQGGSIADLLPQLDTLLASGKNVVMDNLFATVASRAGVLKIADKHQSMKFCISLNTTLEESQFNACLRMMERVGRILDPKELTGDPNLFPMAVIYKYRKELERPTTAEGFDGVQHVSFNREWPKEWVNEAFIFDYDGTLRKTKSGEKFPTSPDDIAILPGRKEKLQALKKAGKLLLGVSNQSGIAKGDLTRDQAVACFKETNRLLGVDIDVLFCPHKVPPITCYCRKPGTGLGVELIVKHKLDPRKCVYVGDMGTDKSFAERCYFQFQDQERFFRS